MSKNLIQIKLRASSENIFAISNINLDLFNNFAIENNFYLNKYKTHGWFRGFKKGLPYD